MVVSRSQVPATLSWKGKKTMPIENLVPIAIFVGAIILFLALGVGGSILSARRFAQTTARLEQQSLERGWQYNAYREGNTTSFNFSGKTNGVSWEMESYYRYSSSSRHSSSSVRYTRWWTEAAALPDDVVLLVPKQSGSPLQAMGTVNMSSLKGGQGMLAGFASSMIQMILNYLVTNVLHAAPEDAQAFENVQQVQAGSEALRQLYMVLSTSEGTASRFLDEDAERLLIEMAPRAGFGGPQLRTMAVVYWHRGIQFIVDGQIMEIDKLEQLIQLGLALASGQKPSVWS